MKGMELLSYSDVSSDLRSLRKVEKEIDKGMIKDAKEVEWNESLLEKRDMSFEEIGAILKAHKISENYDYSRVVSIDYTNMRSPGEYIKHGGICRDAANAVANILVNNGYESMIVYTMRVEASPHVFVVTRDHDGSYYIVNYEEIYEVHGAENMAQTASSYSQFLTLYLMDPRTHKVTDIVASADSKFLENIVGIR